MPAEFRKEMKFCFARVFNSRLIVDFRTETMSHNNGNFSSLEAAVARPES
jgi:hypothetical protein